MIEEDTIKLLRECDAGVKMGVSSIEDVLQYVENPELRNLLSDSKNEHNILDEEIQKELDAYHDTGKMPNPMAKGFSKIKSNVKMMAETTDHTAADLIMSGCDMGIKSLSKYLNQYAAADEKSKSLAKRLITLEDELSKSMRDYI